MRPVRAIASFAAALATALSLAASGSARADDPAADEVRIDLSREIRIPDLLNLLAANTGRPVLWSADDKAVINKKLGGTEGASIRTSKRRLLSVIRGLLVPYEVLLIPMGTPPSESLVGVDARALASQYIWKLRPQVEVTEQNVAELEFEDGLFASATIPAPNLESLQAARSALSRIVTQNNIGFVQEIPDAKAIYVADFAPNVAQVWRAVRRMDAAAEKRRPRALTLPLAHARAEKLASVLLDLWTPVASGKPPVPGEPPASRPRVTADPATNSLVLVASPEDLETLRSVVEKLDQPEKPGR